MELELVPGFVPGFVPAQVATPRPSSAVTPLVESPKDKALKSCDSIVNIGHCRRAAWFWFLLQGLTAGSYRNLSGVSLSRFAARVSQFPASSSPRLECF